LRVLGFDPGTQAERLRPLLGSQLQSSALPDRLRVAEALDLFNRPRLVILDELTQGLDPAARRNVWDAIRQLNDEGTTVLLVRAELKLMTRDPLVLTFVFAF